MTGRSGEGSGALPPLRWLSSDDVIAAMPPLEERLRLAELTMVALARPGASELPPKIAIHPRPEASFVHAMPSHLRGDDPAGDLVGMKWVAGYATNTALGLPGIHATVVVNDPQTGIPTAILDGGPITAERTAAVTGVALRHFGPAAGGRDDTGGRAVELGMIGAGVQGRSHLAVFAGLLPRVRLRIFDRSPERAAALASEARAMDGIAAADVAPTAREAVEGAEVVFSAASFGPAEERQTMTNDWLREDATVVPIDYATYCSAEVVREAALFVVDQRDQYLANREAGNFDGYPDPTATIGEAILSDTRRPEGRVVVTHLGVGLADLVFADAIVKSAEAAGLGTVLPR
jgi:ornithine cyclodeaminase/alanine dehydrogenase-like protein (mu-crystallin family)